MLPTSISLHYQHGESTYARPKIFDLIEFEDSRPRGRGPGGGPDWTGGGEEDGRGGGRGEDRRLCVKRILNANVVIF